MLAAPPNTPVKLCIQVDPAYVGGNQVVARVKDESGTELARVVLNRLADTMLYCGDFTTPSENKVLGVDYRIEDSGGNLVEDLPDELLIVSDQSLESLVRQIKDTLDNTVVPKLNDIKSVVDEINSKVDSLQSGQSDIQGKLNQILD